MRRKPRPADRKSISRIPPSRIGRAEPRCPSCGQEITPQHRGNAPYPVPHDSVQVVASTKPSNATTVKWITAAVFLALVLVGVFVWRADIPPTDQPQGANTENGANQSQTPQPQPQTPQPQTPQSQAPQPQTPQPPSQTPLPQPQAPLPQSQSPQLQPQTPEPQTSQTLLDQSLPLDQRAQIDPQTRAKQQAQTEAQALLGPYQVVYLTEGGIAIVDPKALDDTVTIAQPIYAGMNDLFAGFGTYAMFDPNGETYGFRLVEDDAAPIIYRLSSRGQVIVGADKSIALAFKSSNKPPIIYVGNLSGVFLTKVDVPPGSRLIEVPYLGVLAVTSMGETLVTTQSGFTTFSDWPLLAANVTHHVEVRCVDSVNCQIVLVDRVTGAESDLPAVLGSTLGRLAIAPNGQYLLFTKENVSTLGTNLLYDVANAELIELAAEVNGVVAWAPDSSVAVWFDRSTEKPQLWVLNTDTTAATSLDLASIGAPPRTGESLLLLP